MIDIITGDIFDQYVEVIVNPWNQNFIPWWLLLPQGVSGQIKKRAGYKPFRELGYTPMKLGSARLTSAGNLKFKGIIHVAGLNTFWSATKFSVQESIRNSMRICKEHNFNSIAFPLIGSGTGGLTAKKVENIFIDYFTFNPINIDVKIVRFDKK